MKFRQEQPYPIVAVKPGVHGLGLALLLDTDRKLGGKYLATVQLPVCCQRWTHPSTPRAVHQQKDMGV